MFPKKLWFTFFIFLFCFTGAVAAEETPAPISYQPFEAAGGYFSCELPVGGEWESAAEQPMDLDFGEYFLELWGPRAEKLPVTISVEYFTASSGSFDGHEDFLEKNSRNVLGETKTARENYGEIQKMTKDGQEVYSIERERMTYLDLMGKSEESALIREKLYVLPAPGGKGFFVIHYTSPSSVYEQHAEVFERIFSTFRPGNILTEEAV